jgi:ubiquinone/menaquinone biosynthesis C-methylase UbiE
MQPQQSDRVFEGSVPELYDQYLVPLIFESYADDLVQRLRPLNPSSVLEVAAGTGVVTRAMAAGLPESTALTCSDLNQPMLDHAAKVGTARPVTFEQADVMQLPFADNSFDAIVCQFGVMFFPDQTAAYREIRRVLRPGGTFLFNTWDKIETNDFADVVTRAVGSLYPDDPPLFLDRTPHGHYDLAPFQRHLAEAGFQTPAAFEPVEARSRAAHCRDPAIAYCQGTPLRDEIIARDPDGLVRATNVASSAIASQFGETDVDGRVRGFVLTAT